MNKVRHRESNKLTKMTQKSSSQPRFKLIRARVSPDKREQRSCLLSDQVKIKRELEKVWLNAILQVPCLWFAWIQKWTVRSVICKILVVEVGGTAQRLGFYLPDHMTVISHFHTLLTAPEWLRFRSGHLCIQFLFYVYLWVIPTCHISLYSAASSTGKPAPDPDWNRASPLPKFTDNTQQLHKW